MYVVDLRSDTLTKPTAAMKQAMVNSRLGDDVYREDPTVNQLEAKLSDMLGKEAALFVPTGTMANLIALMVHCSVRGAEAFVGNLSHIYKYQVGGAAHLGSILLSTFDNHEDGTFDLQELEKRIRGGNTNEPISTVVAIENSHNVCGGKVLPLKFISDVAALCKKHSLSLHMDGARLFNACEFLREPPARVVRACDSVAVCFSKGLSAPVGSALIGNKEFIEKARRIRKMLGGGMRQAGVLASAVLVGLDEMIPLLHLDHKRARRLGTAIQNLQLSSFSVDNDIHTNIVLVYICVTSRIVTSDVVKKLAHDEMQSDGRTSNDEGIVVKASTFGPKIIRFTLHKDISDKDLSLAIKKISNVLTKLDGNDRFVAKL